MVEIRVSYSCKNCKLRDIACTVPARENEDIRTWLDSTIILLMYDHNKRSPQCHTKELSDIKIPMIGTDKIGGPSLN